MKHILVFTPLYGWFNQLHCVTFLQYSWRSITPPFPNHIKLEQLNSRCSAMQPACVRHFWSNYFVITMDMINMFWAKTNFPFQSILEHENQLADDALNELIASNYCKYCLKVVFHLKLSFCRTNYTSMMSAMCLIMKQSTSTKLVKSSQAVSRLRTSLGGVALPC